MAADYDRTQPHYRPENVARVTETLRQLAEITGGGSLLDLGCGTGFILNLAKPFFRRVVGVDITQAMLDRVDRSGGNVELWHGRTEELPYEIDEFDVCTAYSYLHHLVDLRPTLSEAARCLRDGGRFFSDQDPNRAFWGLMTDLADAEVAGFVAREVAAVRDTVEDAAAEVAVRPEEVALAEYQKVYGGGLDPQAVRATLLASGFRTAEPRYEWFLGQGKVLHEQGPGHAEVVEAYLREALPASRPFFKYVSFFATK
ncbi:MAG: class I SAM-dependent methyltransferase [Solirubrobacteraceae bacterium]